MVTPEQLSKKQVESIREWAAEGLDLNAIQKKINEEFHLSPTFMDTRFLLIDLGIELISGKREEEGKKEDEGGETPAATGTTTVTVDEITPAHAIISGKVTFASGKRGTWFFDKMGRIDWTPLDGEPSEEDLQDFEAELQKVLRSRMGGI